MTDRLDFETRLERRLRARAAIATRPFDAAAIAREAVAVNGRRRRLAGLEWPSGRPALRWQAMALLLAIALLGAVAAVGALLREPDPVPVERMSVVGHVIDAVSKRNAESLRALLTEDAVLEFPGIDGRAGREGDVYVSDRKMTEDFNLPESWLEAIDRWGMEAHLGSCQTLAGATISCAVRTRFRTLQLEIGEEWTFEFDGARVIRLGMLRVDSDPPDRLMPLTLADLPAWEAWLRDAHPDRAARMLPSGPDVFAHYYFRIWGDASPEEIRDSIDEYLESRDPLFGTYVCSEGGNPASAHTWEVREDGTIIRGPDESGEAGPAGTWSRDNGRLLTTFGGGITWFVISGDRLVGPGGDWTCTRDRSR